MLISIFLDEVFQTIVNNFKEHIKVIPHCDAVKIFRDFESKKRSSYFVKTKFKSLQIRLDPFHDTVSVNKNLKIKSVSKFFRTTHLDFLESEAIHIIREAVTDCKKTCNVVFPR
jgi:hypothetical protein